VEPVRVGSWCAEAALHGLNFQNTWYLRCAGNATMDIVRANYGNIRGRCEAGGGLATSLNCTMTGPTTEQVQRQCNGRNGCVLEVSFISQMTKLHRDSLRGCPYQGERLIVEATCSDGSVGQATPCVPWLDFLYKTCIVDKPAPPAPWPYDSPPVPGPPLYSQAFQTAARGDRLHDGDSSATKKLLLVNKANRRLNVTLPSNAGTLHLVDPASVGSSSAAGIRQVQVQSAVQELLPFAVGVFVLPDPL
jgi:hypothetical protein